MNARTNLTNLRSSQAVLTADGPAAAPAGKADLEHVPLANIKTDGGTQMRAGLNDDAITEYRDVMRENGWGDFPPIVVYYDGSVHWLADGFHRLAAYRQVGVSVADTVIPAIVKAGGRRDAVLYAASANASHGLRRTNADKRRAVETLLRDEEWGKWSKREIARRCGVSDVFVGDVAKDLSANGLQIDDTRTVQRNGRVYLQNTANIGNRPQTYLSFAEIMNALRPVLAAETGEAVWECAAGRNPVMRAACERALHPERARKRDLIVALYKLAGEKGVGLSGKLAVDGDEPLPEWVDNIDMTNGAPEPVPASPRGVLDDLHTSPPDEDSDAPGAEIDTLGPVVASDATASRQHGTPLGKCRVCNRPLYDPAQAAAGIGACCAAKLAAGSHADGELGATDTEAQRSTWDYWAAQGWRLVRNETAQRIGRPFIAAVHDDTQVATPMMAGEPSVIYWLSSNGLLSAANYAAATASAASARSQEAQIRLMIETLEAAAGIIGAYEKLTGIYTHSRPLRQACTAMIETLNRKAQ